MATLEDIKNGLDPDVVKIVDEIKQRFPNAKMTSGFRAGAKTTNGKVSRHSKGEAADFSIDNDVLKFLESKEGTELLYKYGLGYIDESLPQNRKWGNAIHIGKDTIPVQKTIERYKSFNNAEPTTTSNTGVVDSAYNPILVESAPQEKKEVKVENNLDKEVQKILEQTKKEDAFLKEMYSEDNGIDSNIYEQEEPTSNVQMADVAGIYNEASNFIDTPIAQQGGAKIIDDNMGQYNHPGKVTRISSPYITMKDVPYDILAIADNGEKRIMKPNEEHYFKNAKTVTEYPILTEAEKRFLKEINKK